MAAIIINPQLVAAISDCEATQESLAKEQGKLVTAMSKFAKKLAAAVKRAANCKKYIASLLQEERIVEIYSDEKILSGQYFNHYVRSESLNVYGGNYYYIVTMRRFCTCDGCQHTGRCKHVEALMDRLSEGEKKAKFAELKAQYDCRSTEWVRMPNGTQRLAHQVNDECLNSLSKMTEQYAQAKREWTPAVAPVSQPQRQTAVLAGASRAFSLFR